jgi:hypothetical protein
VYTGTVTCLALGEDKIVSGSDDMMEMCGYGHFAYDLILIFFLVFVVLLYP